MQATGAPSIVGSALLVVLVTRHAGLPARTEADILLAAHGCFAAGGGGDIANADSGDGCNKTGAGSCRNRVPDGVDAVFMLAGSAVTAWAAQKEWHALVRLVKGAYPAHPFGASCLLAQSISPNPGSKKTGS